MNATLAQACGWTLTRTIILTLLAWPLIVGIERWMRSLPDSRRPFAFAILMAPFLFPELVVGYAYRNAALAAPKWAELLCASLLFVRVVPVGVATLLVSPAAMVSSSAIHCRWMLLRADPCSISQWWQISLCYINGPVRRALPALALISIVSFQEFELAALLQTASWTDWFIAAQRVRLDRSKMLEQSFRPILTQLPFLLGVFLWFLRPGDPSAEQNVEIPVITSRWAKTAGVIYLGFALIAGAVVPLCVIGRNMPTGLMLMARQPAQRNGLAREILIAASISLVAGTAAWFIARLWSNRKSPNVVTVLLENILLIPGLVGSLLLSLATVVAFQQPWLRPLYDTPIPWILALLVWLLPRAVLLRLWVETITRTESVYLAQMLVDPPLPIGNERATAPHAGGPTLDIRPRQTRQPRGLLFRLRDQPQLLAVGLLCYWAYLDLSTAYLLAPSGLNSGLVRLYDFMHFGRSAALSAESFLFFGAPLVATILAMQLFRAVAWRRTDSA